MGTAIKHPVPDWVKLSFVFLWHPGTLTLSPSIRVPDVKNYTWRLNPVWHRMLYSCPHMVTVGVKGLNATWQREIEKYKKKLKQKSRQAVSLVVRVIFCKRPSCSKILHHWQNSEHTTAVGHDWRIRCVHDDFKQHYRIMNYRIRQGWTSILILTISWWRCIPHYSHLPPAVAVSSSRLATTPLLLLESTSAVSK